MTAMRSAERATILRLQGEVGRDQCSAVVRAVRRALAETCGEVWVDLDSTRHLHYEVARALVQAARDDRRLCLVGATPYVEQILRLAGGTEGDVWGWPAAERQLGDAVA